MTQFYKASEQPVEWYATKYDDCTMKATGVDYRHQKGSGRSEVITRFAAANKRLGDITKEAAAVGFDPNFVVSSIFKHHDTVGGAWKVEAPEGLTIDAIKKQRQTRKVSPEALAKREAAAAARAEKVAARDAAKAERDKEQADKVAAREAAKAEREAARAAKAEASKADKPAKGKGKAKKADPADGASSTGADPAAA
jgi:hypothetical protein